MVLSLFSKLIVLIFCNFYWNLHRMYAVSIFSFFNYSMIHFAFLHTPKLVLLIYSWMCGLLLEHGWHTRGFSVNHDYPCPRKLSIVPQLGSGTPCPHSISLMGLFIWLKLQQVMFYDVTITLSTYIQLACYVRNIIFHWNCLPSPPCSCNPVVLSSAMIIELMEEMVWWRYTS